MRGEASELGRFTEERAGWVTLAKYEAIVYVGDNTDFLRERGIKPEGGEEHVKLAFKVAGRPVPFVLALTAMTTNELTELRRCIEWAFDRAAPVVEALDRAAQQAWEDGDDSWSRLYRPDVTFHKRGTDDLPGDRLHRATTDERVQPEHDPGLSVGPLGRNGVSDCGDSEHLHGPDNGDPGDRVRRTDPPTGGESDGSLPA